MKKVNVMVSGIHYPVSIMKYFIHALQRREDIQVYTCGPFTNSWIPWNGGMTISMKYVEPVDVPLTQEFIHKYPVRYKQISHSIPEKMDIWIQIDAGFHLQDRPDVAKTIGIMTDPHAIGADHYNVLRENSDVVYNMQTPYIQPGDLYLPYAFDPTVHYPEDCEKEYDLAIIGLQYDQRVQIANGLKQRGFKVLNTIGIVFDEYRKAYNRSRLALNVSSKDDLPARVFEYAAMKVPFLTNRNIPDLKRFFAEGDHFVGFDIPSAAVDFACGMLSDYDKCIEMAERAYEKNKANTYDNRVSQILTGLL